MAQGAGELHLIGLARLVTDGHTRIHEITDALGDAGNKLRRVDRGSTSIFECPRARYRPQLNGRWQRWMSLAVGGEFDFIRPDSLGLGKHRRKQAVEELHKFRSVAAGNAKDVRFSTSAEFFLSSFHQAGIATAETVD